MSSLGQKAIITRQELFPSKEAAAATTNMATHHNYFLTTIAWQAIGIQLQKQDEQRRHYYKEIPQLHTLQSYTFQLDNKTIVSTTFKIFFILKYLIYVHIRFQTYSKSL